MAFGAERSVGDEPTPSGGRSAHAWSRPSAPGAAAAPIEASPVRLRAHLHDDHRRDPLRLPERDDDSVALHRFEHFEAELGLIRLDHEH